MIKYTDRVETTSSNSAIPPLVIQNDTCSKLTSREIKSRSKNGSYTLDSQSFPSSQTPPPLLSKKKQAPRIRDSRQQNPDRSGSSSTKWTESLAHQTHVTILWLDTLEKLWLSTKAGLKKYSCYLMTVRQRECKTFYTGIALNVG